MYETIEGIEYARSEEEIKFLLEFENDERTLQEIYNDNDIEDNRIIDILIEDGWVS